MSEENKTNEQERQLVALLAAERTAFFSDAVFAIAMTLLILDVYIHGFSAGHLGHSLAAQWPAYLAFAASFFYVAVMWVNHHMVFAKLHSVDKHLMWANVGIIFGAVILSFPTSVLAQAMEHGNRSDQRAAVALYAVLATLMALSWLFLFTLIIRRPNTWVNHDDGAAWRHLRCRSAPGPLAT